MQQLYELGPIADSSGISGSLQAASKTFICKRCQAMVPHRGTSGIASTRIRNSKAQSLKLWISSATLEICCSCQRRWDSSLWPQGFKVPMDRQFCELISLSLTSRATLTTSERDRWYEACVQKCMTYGIETWAMKSSSVERVEKAEMRMVRWVCRASLYERKKNEDHVQSMGLGKDRAGDEEEFRLSHGMELLWLRMR